MTNDPAALRSGKGHRDENFPVASRLIHPRHRGIILAFYEFVRSADDIADHATLAPQQKLDLLDRLEASLLGRHDDVPEAVALRRVLSERKLPPRHAQDLLHAFRMDARKLRYLRMISRAYHDSLFMSRIAPTGMIFIPCRGGVSHRPDEYASPDAIAHGTAVLADTLASLAG